MRRSLGASRPQEARSRGATHSRRMRAMVCLAIILAILLVVHVLSGTASSGFTIPLAAWYASVLDTASAATTTFPNEPFAKQEQRRSFLQTLTSQQQQQSPPPWTIFYNVFIPTDNSTGTENAVRIVREQLQQVMASPRVANMINATNSNVKIPVVLVTMGREHVLTPETLDKLCPPPLECRVATHLAEGTEADTLHHVQEYCQLVTAMPMNDEDSDTPPPQQRHVVTYLHNKGSYQRIEFNENWRRALTRAALSEECLDPVNRRVCDVCALNFYLQWTPFFPGNMFSADCAYIDKLMDIQDYKIKLAQLAGEVMIRTVQQEFVSTRHNREQADFYGLDRFYAEHWIGSHPDLVPCDVGPLPFRTYGDQDTSHAPLEWALAPRSNVHRTTIFANPYFDRQIRERREIRWREFFGSAGQMYRWLYLYGRIPNESSWVWSNYDDAKMWQDAIKEHGIHAVKAITSEWSLASNQPAFRDNAPDNADAWELRLKVEPKHAIFYKAHVPLGSDPSVYQLEVELIERQLALLASSFTEDENALVVIDTSGHSLLKASVLCADKPSLECRRMGHLGSELYHGETLQRLYNFCHMHPSSRVTYLTNHLMPHHANGKVHDGEKRDKVLEITIALAQQSCMKGHNEANQCHVCGAALDPLPYIHLAGNMWSAECAYISKLIPPVQFASKMHDFLVKALPMRRLGQLKTGIFEDKMEIFGMEGYALDHWVGSHPSMVPCDWSSISHWNKGTFKGAAISGWAFDAAKHDNVMKDEDQRLLEFSFLAGLMMKWYMLYGELPATDSWVYQVFPDGEYWQKEGQTFVEKYVTTA